MRVTGLDLSLASTGLVTVTEVNGKWRAGALRVRPPADMHGHERLAWVLGRIEASLADRSDWVIIEAPAYARNLPGAHARAGLWWMVAHGCWTRHQPYDVVSPPTLKVFATGSGKAEKDQVLAQTIHRYPGVAISGNDVADAMVLAAMGFAYLGRPLVALPKEHTRALKGVTWSEFAQESRDAHGAAA